MGLDSLVPVSCVNCRCCCIFTCRILLCETLPCAAIVYALCWSASPALICGAHSMTYSIEVHTAKSSMVHHYTGVMSPKGHQHPMIQITPVCSSQLEGINLDRLCPACARCVSTHHAPRMYAVAVTQCIWIFLNPSPPPPPSSSCTQC